MIASPRTSQNCEKKPWSEQFILFFWQPQLWTLRTTTIAARGLCLFLFLITAQHYSKTCLYIKSRCNPQFYTSAFIFFFHIFKNYGFIFELKFENSCSYEPYQPSYNHWRYLYVCDNRPTWIQIPNQCCALIRICEEVLPIPVFLIFPNQTITSSGCLKKIRIKELPVLVIRKTLKNQWLSWKNSIERETLET
jgi:hypothetical protein